MLMMVTERNGPSPWGRKQGARRLADWNKIYQRLPDELLASRLLYISIYSLLGEPLDHAYGSNCIEDASEKQECHSGSSSNGYC